MHTRRTLSAALHADASRAAAIAAAVHTDLCARGTREVTSRNSLYAAGSAVLRWRIEVPGGLEDKPVGFSNLAGSGLDVLVRVERADGTEQLARIMPTAPNFTLRASPGRFEVARTYTFLGIEHIWTGVDHLLFVLALIMIVRGKRRLLATITAFTIAHSIVFVAREIINLYRGREGLAAHWRRSDCRRTTFRWRSFSSM